jgi:hypothetical protein
MGAEAQARAGPDAGRRQALTPLAAARSLSAAFVVLVGSRVIGLFREVLITLTFGFSKLTDLFFQATFVPTSLMNVLNGPFTTAFLASFNAAGPAERGAWLNLYRRRALELGLMAAPLFLAGGAAAALLVPAADRGNVLLTCALLAPACTAVVMVGYVAAAANACGMVARANGLIALMNLAFVAGVLTLWISGAEGRSWMLPAAFTLASSAGAVLGWRWLGGMIAEQAAAWGPQAPAPARRLPGLNRSFVLALAEHGGSLATQLIVLSLATHAGVGWASAAALAQRICLSAIGFVVFPVANLAAVQIIHAPARAARLFALTMLAMAGGAAVVALALIWLREPLQAVLVATSRLDAAQAGLLVDLIAPFSLWLVAMAAYIPANKVMFAIGRGRLCVTVSLAAYGLANTVRLIAGLQGRFGLAIALGAAIELILALGLAAITWTLLRRRAAGA